MAPKGYYRLPTQQMASFQTTPPLKNNVQSKGRIDGRIYLPGGRPVQPGEFPFLALLEIAVDDKMARCSGSIPSKTTVLTAAHCDVGDITAFAGSVNIHDQQDESIDPDREDTKQMRKVESVVKPKYPAIFDIMICYVKEPWDWTDYVKPVTLHLSGKSLQPSFVIACQVMGFGETELDSETGAAHVMDQLVGSSAQCLDLHPVTWFCSFWMCSINLRNKTVCQGDSGGPVICSSQRGNLQWAVNYGMAPKTDPDCVPTKTANVYVATAYFRNWITSNIKDLPSRADSIHRRSVKIPMYKALLHRPLWLLLLVAVQLLYLN